MSPTILVGGLWLGTTALFSNTANTIFMREMKSSVAHNLTRFVGAVVLCLLFGFFSSKTRPQTQHLRAFLVPATCMVVMNVANSVALGSVGVTLTYVVKATIPVWTCLYCFVFEGQTFSKKIIFSLLLSCIGVCLASAGDFNFNVLGFSAACVSTLAQFSFNIFGKKCVAACGTTPMQGFATALINASVLASVLYNSGIEETLGLNTFPVYSYSYQRAFSKEDPDYFAVWILGITFVSYFCEYGLNFVYFAMVSNVTFAITDIVRRIGTICANAVIYGYILTPLNGSGIFLSLFGALLYTWFTAQDAAAEVGQKKGRKASTTPPPTPAEKTGAESRAGAARTRTSPESRAAKTAVAKAKRAALRGGRSGSPAPEALAKMSKGKVA